MSFYHKCWFSIEPYVFISQTFDARRKYETTSKLTQLDANEIFISKIINLHSEIASVFGRNVAKKVAFMSTKLSVNCNVNAHWKSNESEIYVVDSIFILNSVYVCENLHYILVFAKHKLILDFFCSVFCSVVEFRRLYAIRAKCS